MSNNKTTATASTSGIGFSGLLTIAFIILKLCHVISWSWWWVLSPLWISVGIALFIILVMIVVLAIAASRGK